MPKNAKKITYKEKEFETYVLWRSMPAYFRGMKKEQLVSHGFNDPLIIKIAMIKNQTAFAKKFNIKDLGTLTDWNNKIKEKKLGSNMTAELFKKQAVGVTGVMTKHPDKLLEKKIFEQQKLISQLRKENKEFKRKLESRAVPIRRKTTPPQAKPAEIELIVHPPINNIEKNEPVAMPVPEPTLFGKIKRIFGWNKN